jgi:hypothetical protein
MNTKHKKYKEYNRLAIKHTENSIAQAKLGYKELDEPYVRGYDVEYVLRADIARREDAWVFQYIIDNLTTSSWSRRKCGTFYDRSLRRDVEIHPEWWTITDRGYNKLKPQVQKYFKKDLRNTHLWWYGSSQYICVVPAWFFERKLKKHYVTHYKVTDEVLLQEEAYLNDKMWGGEYKCFNWYNGGMKPYAKMRNRSDRKYNKQTLQHNMGLIEPALRYDHSTGEVYEDTEDWHSWEGGDVQGKEFRYHHRHSAKWDRW